MSNTNALTEFLPEVLSSFLATHPHVSIDLEERLSDEIVGLIAEGVADIGIVASTVDAGRLKRFPFRRDRFVLVVPDRHPLARRHTVSFEEILDHDFVGLERQSAAQRFFADKAAKVADLLQHDWVRWGGGLYASAFLREFTGGLPWAHLDIAGPAFASSGPSGHVTAGGTGFAVSTLVDLARSMADRAS